MISWRVIITVERCAENGWQLCKNTEEHDEFDEESSVCYGYFDFDFCGEF